MMGTRYKKVIIDDVVAQHIDSSCQEKLLDVCEYAVIAIAVTLAYEARFKVDSYRNFDIAGCEGFDLLVRRKRLDDFEYWEAVFTHEEQHMTVLAHLE